MTEHEIQKDISLLTEQLRIEKPEVYRHLMENPKTFRDPDMDFESQLKGYRDTLRQLLTRD
jgi:hypothetical protein